MALIFTRSSAYRSFGKLFRNIVVKETTLVGPIKPSKFNPSTAHTQQSQGFYTSTPKYRDPKKLYEMLLRGKNRGVPVWLGMTVKDLADSFNRPPAAVCEVLEKITTTRWRKLSATLDDMDVIREICKLFRVKPSIITKNPNTAQKEEKLVDRDVYPRPMPPANEMVKRPPVVTVMGHVDHGKTTLLDSLRNTQVVQSEFGGITQHIGAFTVKVRDETITFMDTPGHAAFTAMRERGAKSTDLVVLVVAADDGVMEQTVESIRMAKEAKVPMIVAVNKIDKPRADVQNTLHELINCEVVTEPVGGEIQAVPVSALTGKGLDDLAEAILAQAEIMDLRADPKGLVEGVVIESKKDQFRGILSTALVQRGTLRKGDVLIAGTALCKVRVMQNHEGVKVNEASPSTPVEVLGWRDIPIPGDIILQVESEKRANEAISYRKHKLMLEKQKSESKVIRLKYEQLYSQYREKRLERLSQGIFKSKRERVKNDVEDENKVRVIIKGDVNGSVDAILDVLATFNSKEVELDVVASGVGEPSESDIELAELFNAIIYCFNLRFSDKLVETIGEKNITMKSYNVIYHLINDLKEEITKKIPNTFREEILGEAKVLEVFMVNDRKNKKWAVAGSECTDGVIHKLKPIRIKRDDEILYDGPIRSLRHLRDEVTSVKSGTQCGIMPDDKELKLQTGDIIISYDTIEQPGKCTWDPGF